jgi:hypothetical protein
MRAQFTPPFPSFLPLPLFPFSLPIPPLSLPAISLIFLISFTLLSFSFTVPCLTEVRGITAEKFQFKEVYNFQYKCISFHKILQEFIRQSQNPLTVSFSTVNLKRVLEYYIMVRFHAALITTNTTMGKAINFNPAGTTASAHLMLARCCNAGKPSANANVLKQSPYYTAHSASAGTALPV